MFSLIYARINAWVNNREAGDYGDYDVIVMWSPLLRGISRHPSQKGHVKNIQQLIQFNDNDNIIDNADNPGGDKNNNIIVCQIV